MARYAWVEVLVIGLLGVVVTVAVALWASWWGLLPAGLALALLSFYRDPPRRVVARPNELLAPADGRIVHIRRVDADAGPEIRIVIFLSVFNVHINRSPCDGQVRSVQHKPGRFLNALRVEATIENEANTVDVDPPAPLPGPVSVRQIAGVLAKRIICTLRPGDQVAAGERFGMIKLGSQTELIMPDDGRWTLCVNLGTRVKAGLTVLAEHNQAAATS